MDPYATHLPVLKALGLRLKIQSVLEFGCGLYSTPAFLDREMFPDLYVLESLEADPEWRMLMRQAFADPRWLLSAPTIQDTWQHDFDAYDLILIDDGRSAAERVQTIRKVAIQPPHEALVVIHDFEVAAYRQAAAPFEHCRVYERLEPHTALLWQGHRPEIEALWQDLFEDDPAMKAA